MISMDKKYTYRNGDPARILCVDAAGEQPVISLTEFGLSLSHRIDGRFSRVDGYVSELDLIEVKEEKTVWLNRWLDYFSVREII